MDLKGKVVFITGAAQGLGKAYSEAMLEKGARVFIADVNDTTGQATAKELGDRFGPDNVVFTKLDITNSQQFEDAFKQCVSKFGQVDIMVNNAGVLNESIWELMIQVNYTALIRGTKLAQEHMRKDKGGKGGRVINISSQAGLFHRVEVPVYCGTKHAVRSYTTSLALQPNLQETRIEYGIFCPGATATDMLLKADSQKVEFYDNYVKNRPESIIMPVSRVVGAFMELVQLESMNGAMMMVDYQEKGYQRMKLESLGTKWPVDA